MRRRWRRIRLRLQGYRGGDYRLYLFEDLRTRLKGQRPLRILEIGPRDGQDTARLLTLASDRLISWWNCPTSARRSMPG